MANGIEFTSKVGKAFTSWVLKSTSYVTLESGATVTEVTPGRYRIVTSRTGKVWVEATAGATKAYGLADCDNPGDNGYSEVVDSLTNGVGASAITVLPLNAAVQDRVDGTTINLFFGEVLSVAIAITDAAGEAVSLAGRTLRIVIEGRTRVDRVVIENGDIGRTGNTISFTPPIGITNKLGRRSWSLRDVTGGNGDGVVLAYGILSVTYAPAKDA